MPQLWLICIVNDCDDLAYMPYGRWCAKHLARFLRHGNELISLGMGRRIEHGHAKAKSSTYRTWCAMRYRCENPSSKSYLAYGARGIQVCERWQSFANFLADMGERPPRMTLDRIDNDGNYEPGNCRWATPAQQRANQRRSKLTREKAKEIRELIGTGLTQPDIAMRFGISRQTVSAIKNGVIWNEAS